MAVFNRKYFFITVIIFVTEVLIALYVKDRFVRPYVGDVLVVILLYCFIRSFFNFPVLPLAVSVLLFSFCIEFLQYIKVVEILNITSPVARTVIGTSFAWQDLVAYSVGVVIVIVAEGRKAMADS